MTRPVRPVLLVSLLTLALAGGGCSMLGGGAGGVAPTATASTSPTAEGQVDVRSLIGPDYCPELRILDGAQLIRRYERGSEENPNAVVWQASFGETARDCLYDTEGGLTIRVGVSGRVIAGPKGSAGEVAVPFKIAVVKFKEAVLASEGHTLTAALPAAGSATFAEVREIKLPSPGRDRDYIIYVGFDVGEWDLEAGTIVAAPLVERPPPAIEEQPILFEEEEPAAAAPPAKPAEPKVLPTPTDGFILPR